MSSEVERSELAWLALGLAVPVAAAFAVGVWLVVREAARGEGRVFEALSRLAAESQRSELEDEVEVKAGAAEGPNALQHGSSSSGSVQAPRADPGEVRAAMRLLGRLSYASSVVMCAMFVVALVLACDLMGGTGRWLAWRIASSDDTADHLFRQSRGANYSCDFLMEGVPADERDRATLESAGTEEDVYISFALVTPLFFYLLVIVLKAGSAVMLVSGLGRWRRHGVFLVFASRLHKRVPLVARVLLQLCVFTAFEILFAMRYECGTESIEDVFITGIFLTNLFAACTVVGVAAMQAWPALQRKTPRAVGIALRLVIAAGILFGLVTVFLLLMEDPSISLSYPSGDITVIAVLKLLNLTLLAVDASAAAVVYSKRELFVERPGADSSRGVADYAVGVVL